MVKFTCRLVTFICIVSGISLSAQEKKQFPNVSAVLQNIVPNTKTDSWILVHKSYGKDNIVKQSTVKEYESQSSGFNIGIADEDAFYYIVDFSTGKPEYITGLTALRKFVGKVDNIYDAAVFAAAEGYIIDEEFRDLAANYYQDKSNYYLDLGKLTSTECPYQKKHFTLTIPKSGETILNTKDNGSYIELYNKKCTNNPRLLKLEKKEEPKDEPKKSKPTRRK
ncbi:hypothetical protein [Chryseobacterium cheonjiense]|uniref:Uncharacterized protein n=1 Tax=Chryseobacterium cheonjiense TaxID=2728845 RepID=A0A7Y0FJA1_9FLAO|nr:hypothetical protein [Chryseobacterium cheonjiense]NML58358.1 hypothetical protein [Chryseobacterium cheonjiense]